MIQRKTPPQEILNLHNCCDSINYLRDNSWHPLPEWANFFLKLGLSLSQFNDDKMRFVASLAVPTRAYSALLIAGGIICGRSTISHYETDQEHLKTILSIPDGTPIIYRDTKKKFNAIKRNSIIHNGKQHIGIQIDGNQQTWWISFEDANRIEISDKDHAKLPKQQKGRDIQPPSSLIQNLVGEAGISNFIVRTRIETVVIGSFHTMKEEMQLNLSYKQGPAIDCPGLLSDLLRVKECQPNGTGSRSSIIPAASKSITKAANMLDPFGVIFDGSHGFLKWRDYWRNFNWIIILDRTEPNFKHTVEHVNQEFYNRSKLPIKIKIPPIATGVELMLYGVDH